MQRSHVMGLNPAVVRKHEKFNSEFLDNLVLHVGELLEQTLAQEGRTNSKEKVLGTNSCNKSYDILI